MKRPNFLIAMFFIFASSNAHAGSAALRIICDGEAEGALVYIDGKAKGECPLDMKVPEGKLSLRAQKDVNGETKTFEQDFYIGDGVMKKVEVHLHGAADKKREAEARLLVSSIESDMVAIPGKGYALGKYEVTQAQWKRVMGNNPSYQPNYRPICGDNCPVGKVSWDDIQVFLSKLNQMAGKQYQFRLPTIDEWEYACYGGSQTLYCGSNDHNAVGWFDNHEHPVGQKQPNGYGLYDMSGNVHEWMQDLEGDEGKRAIRGGDYDSSTNLFGKNWALPTLHISLRPHARFVMTGFRLARTLH